MSAGVVTIQRDRTETVTVQLPSGVGAGYVTAGDTFTAQIRATRVPTSTLIATCTVSTASLSASDQLLLTLDNSVTAAITADRGWVDVIRTSGGEPYRVFDEPVQVVFVDMPTAVA